MSVAKGIKHVCFICLKQFKFTKETEQLLESRGHSTPPQIYKKFITFASEYLQLAKTDSDLSSQVEDDQSKASGGGRDANQSMKMEFVCELCSTEISKVFKIYKELLLAEIRLRAKLEEVGNLIKESGVKSEKVVSSSLTFLLSGNKRLIRKVEKLRSEIVQKCFQKRGQTSEFLGTPTTRKSQATAEGDNKDDDDIKPDFEILEDEMDPLTIENSSLPLKFAGVNDAKEREADDTFQSFLIPDVTFGAENDDDNAEVPAPFQSEALDRFVVFGESDEDSDASFQPSLGGLVDADGSESSSSCSVEMLSSDDEDEVEFPLKQHPIGVKSSVSRKSQQQRVLIKKAIKRKRYPCPYCRSSFDILSERAQHIQTRHRSTATSSFYCDNDEDTNNGCTATFPTQSELNSHLQTHSKPIHSCNFCEAKFLNPNYLKLHEIFHLKWSKGLRRNERRILCPIPSCIVWRTGCPALQSHYNLKHGKRVKFFKCSRCEQRVTTHYKLKSHLDAHDNPKPIPNSKCQHCDIDFRFAHILAIHIPKCEKNPEREPEPEIVSPRRRPVGNMSKICGDFVKGLSFFPIPQSPEPQTEHVPTKNLKVIYTCKVCGEMVKGLENFRAHIRNTHPKKQAKEHCVCQMCGDSFEYRSALSSHIYQAHGEGRFVSKRRKYELSFVCATCGKAYTNRSNLKAHEVIHVIGEKERKYTCHLCPLKFLTKNTLKFHLVKIHHKMKGQEFTPGEGSPRKDWKCQYTSCVEEFFEESKLKVHVAEKHFTSSSQFMCIWCGRLFTNRQRLTRHNVVHTKEKLHKCDKCERAYSLRQTLVEHVREVHSEGEVEKKGWPCTQPGCESRLKCRKYLLEHLKKTHGISSSKKVKMEGENEELK